MNTKAAFSGLALSFLLAGCTMHQPTDTSKFDAGKVSYDIDPRTGICYAVTGSEEQGKVFNGIFYSMAAVPATKEVLAQIKPEKLEVVKKAGITPVTWVAAPANANTPKPELK